ncbi:TetR/AcrR family transcriptional regulator [Saccharopolyspora cebuensis]|uniref:TetR/AcrR family transcriptional regulator n=1 Tax=Saccharopolyspora cebuensis TaxID=418759 RepID=A0ABV4CG87_9PSEU
MRSELRKREAGDVHRIVVTTRRGRLSGDRDPSAEREAPQHMSITPSAAREDSTGSGRTAAAGAAGKAQGKGPARRERIARAAIDVVAERGLDKLTHRAVAAQAGVPLGSTTYYFRTLDDLLAMALRQAAADDVAHIRRWATTLGDGDFVGALADLVLHYLGPARSQTAVQHELYLAALHRPALRHVSQEWDAELAELFTAHTDAITGRALSAAFCGLLLQGVVRESVPAREEVEQVFRRVLGA